MARAPANLHPAVAGTPPLQTTGVEEHVGSPPALVRPSWLDLKMPRTTQSSTGKLSGPCRLCNTKRSTSWRRIPAAAGSAAGLTACNPCYVYIAKQVRDDPAGIPEALDACRAAKRARLTPLGADGEEDDEEDEAGEDEEEAASPGGDAGSSGGGFMDWLLRNSGRAAEAAAAAAAGSSPAAGESSVRVGDNSNGAAATSQPGLMPQPGSRQEAPLPGRLGLSEQQEAPRRLTRQSRQRSPSPPPRLARAASGPQPGLPMQMPPPLQRAASHQLPEPHLLQLQQAAAAQRLPAQLSSLPSSSLATPSAAHAGADGGARLRALRDASCRLFGDSEAALMAMRRAYYTAAGQLPGVSPELLAPLPCCWLLLPGAGRLPQPAGAVLLSVNLPPRGINEDAQMLLLGAGMGLESSVRLVVHCPHTGQLLASREWVQQDEHALYLHPRYHVPTWDSSEGWKLLFPDPASDTAQARLLSGIVEAFGCQPRSAAAVPSFTVGGRGERLTTMGSSSLADAGTLLHSQAASTPVTAAAAAPHMATPVQQRQAPLELPPFELPAAVQQQQQQTPSPFQQAAAWPARQGSDSLPASQPLVWHAAAQQAERGAGRQQQATPTAATPLLSLAQHGTVAFGPTPSSVTQQHGALDLPRQWPVHIGPAASQAQGSSAQTAAPSSWRRTAEALQQHTQQQSQAQVQQQQAHAFVQHQQQAQAQAQSQALAQQQQAQQRQQAQQQQSQQAQQQQQLAHALDVQRLAAVCRSGNLADSLLGSTEVLQHADPLLQTGLLSAPGLELTDVEMFELINCLGSGSGSDFFL